MKRNISKMAGVGEKPAKHWDTWACEIHRPTYLGYIHVSVRRSVWGYLVHFSNVKGNP